MDAPRTGPMNLSVPSLVAREITELARRAARSTGFIARRALTAARGKPTPPVDGAERTSLALTVDEDDERRTLAKVAELLAERGGLPGDALAAAWIHSRAAFHAWLARLEEADRASHADDLDGALAEAASDGTQPARLAELAAHEYVQVRARVARHPATPEAALELLAKEREKSVRTALLANPSLPPSLRERLTR